MGHSQYLLKIHYSYHDHELLFYLSRCEQQTSPGAASHRDLHHSSILRFVIHLLPNPSIFFQLFQDGAIPISNSLVTLVFDLAFAFAFSLASHYQSHCLSLDKINFSCSNPSPLWHQTRNHPRRPIEETWSCFGDRHWRGMCVFLSIIFICLRRRLQRSCKSEEMFPRGTLGR